MQRETIQINNSKLSGEWRHGSLRRHLVILCHGYQSSGDSPALVALADGLNEAGHDTFTFDFSPSLGGFDIEQQVADVARVVAHFGEYDELVLFAGSLAALTGAIAASDVPGIDKLVTLNGFFGTGELGPERRGTYRIFRLAALVLPRYRKILRYYQRYLRPEEIKVPVLVIHSSADEVVLIAQSRTFYAALTAPKRWVELADVDHGLTQPRDQARVVTEINNWLNAHVSESLDSSA